MRLLVYEFCVGGGLAGDDPLVASLRREGSAMLQALTHDLGGVPGVQVVTLLEAASPLESQFPAAEIHHPRSHESCTEALGRVARTCDMAWIIAPESDGWLARLVDVALAAGCQLLGPLQPCVELTSDKTATARHLAERGVRTPIGLTWDGTMSLPTDFAFPAVCKPLDGAGALATLCAENRDQLLRHAREYADEISQWRLETFCPGEAVSVAVVSGPAGHWTLPPFRQRLTRDGRLRYLGGERLLDAELCRRAGMLASQTVKQLPAVNGYLGVDMVLGPATDGSPDVVIEVNPRLTTSYIGLRAISRTNLAGAVYAAPVGVFS